MAGTVFSEQAGTLQRGDGRKNEWSQKEIDEQLTAAYGDKKDDIVAEFKKAFPRKKVQDVLLLRRRLATGVKTTLARKLEKGKTPVYNYLFAYEYPVNGGITSFHCAEIAFVFHNLTEPHIRIATGGDAGRVGAAGQGLAGVDQLRPHGQSQPAGPRVQALHGAGSAGHGVRHGQRMPRAERRRPPGAHATPGRARRAWRRSVTAATTCQNTGAGLDALLEPARPRLRHAAEGAVP